jgi:hypothetical protein
MIEFPCPEPIENMTPNASGVFCHSCNKPLTDISSYSQMEKDQFSKANPTACVIDIDEDDSVNWFSTRKFALALLIASTSTLFACSEPNTLQNIDNIRESLINETSNDSIRLTIKIENQHGTSIRGYISVELPNGKTVVPEYVLKRKAYEINLPAYCDKKTIKVTIERSGTVKTEKIKISAKEENLISTKLKIKDAKPIKKGKYSHKNPGFL